MYPISHSKFLFQLVALAKSFSVELKISSVPALFFMWVNWHSSGKLTSQFSSRKLNGLISSNCGALSLVLTFLLVSFEPSPDFKHAFKNARDRSHSGMKYHSHHYYMKRCYIYI